MFLTYFFRKSYLNYPLVALSSENLSEREQKDRRPEG
jgi:hypothetical protein